MRFLHTSDLHIGKTVCGFSMLEEQRNALRQIKEIATEKKVDVVLLSGDLYDRALPPSQAVTLLDDFLTELIGAGIMVCAIAGNHDSGERIGFVNRILERQGLYLEGIQGAEVRYVDWERDGEQVRIHLMPFAKPAELRALLKQEIHTCEEGMKALLDQVEYTKAGKNILLTHGFIVNQGKEPELSESETRVSVGGADQVEVSLLAPFDYVALGHIHGQQRIGSKAVYYSGSPVKYSFSEVNHIKSVIIGEWDLQGALTLTPVPLTPIHDMRKIRGLLGELINPSVVEAADAEDYLLVVLTNEEELVDPIGTLRSVYPNVMQLQLERLSKREGTAFEGNTDWKEKTPRELFAQFYEYVMDTGLTGEQEALMEEVLEQVKEDVQ